ncbi:MAG: DMT family transporter [Clostridia bacterium]|nr:DMT family transporter [Clostridia bacterium]
MQILKRNAGRLALLTAALIWGSSFIIMKGAVDDVPVFMLLAVRFSIAFMLLGAIFIRKLLKADRQTLLGGMLCGMLLFGAYTSQTFGLMGTTPGKNAFLTAVYCVLVPFLSWVFFRKRPTVWNWVAAVMCVAGIGFVSLTGDLTIDPGDGLTLLGGLFYAFHIILLGRLGDRCDPIALTIVQFGSTAAFSWLFCLLAERGSAFPPAGIWPQLLYLAVLCTGLTILLQTVGQKLTPPSQAAILMSLESVFGVFFSLLMGAETLTLPLVCGFALIFCSVIISETQLSFLRKKS